MSLHVVRHSGLSGGQLLGEFLVHFMSVFFNYEIHLLYENIQYFLIVFRKWFGFQKFFSASLVDCNVHFVLQGHPQVFGHEWDAFLEVFVPVGVRLFIQEFDS